MAVIRAAASLGNVLSDTLPVDMGDLFLYDADATPLLAFTQDLKKTRQAKQAKYQHLSNEPIAQYTQVNNGAGYNSSATGIVVDDGGIANVNDVLMNMTSGEHFLVTAVNTNTLTVTRGYGETAAASMADNDYVVRVGSSFAEGTTSPDPLVQLETNNYNYTQIFKEAVSVTGTAAASEFYTGDQLKKLIFNAQVKIKRDMEFSFIFGERSITNGSGNQPQRTSRGLNASIVTNRFAIAGTLTQDYFIQNVLPAVFRYGSNRKVIYCGEKMLACFTDWGLDRLQTFTSDTMLGFSAKQYISPYGDLMIVRHKLLTGPMAGYAFIVDPEYVYRVDLKGRGLKLYPKVQANDYDGEKAMFMAECGWEFPLEKCNAALTGITGPG